MEKYKVKFYPDNKVVEVEKDKTILSAALSAGVYINSACGGDGVCGRCKVILRKGKVSSPLSSSLSASERKNNFLLACMATVHSDLEIEIPAESRVTFEKSADEIYSKSEEIESISASLDKIAFNYLPLVRKIYLEIPKPTLEDSISDLERLYREIRNKVPEVFTDERTNSNIQTGLINIKQLADLLRDSEWKITVTIANRDGVTEVISVDAQDTSQRNYAICFDIGTTTITSQLLDLNSKKILGTKASYNKQASFGSDIITRIIYAQKAEGLSKLHRIVIETINGMIRELSSEHKIDLNDLGYLMCTGNTTMMHLLLEIDPTNIRREPYVPTANFLPAIRAAEIGIQIKPRGLLFCMPGISSYVGGDTTAGVLSTNLYNQDKLSLLIDIGTNGEIAFGDKSFLISCAASAGPAFEGSGVACGMRASSGAIQKAVINQADLDVKYETIGNAKPRGICGSGYIDIIAQMLSCGIIDKGGKIQRTDSSRFRIGEYGSEFVLVAKKDTGTSSDIFITEADIDNIKRAKAAIYSAAMLLIKKMNFDISQVENIFIAGGFGTYLNIENAIKIGLLPDIDRQKFRFVGNSALAGARQVLVSYDAFKKAHDIAKRMAYLDLSQESQYMDEYMAALFFPHTDLDKFPSIKRR